MRPDEHKKKKNAAYKKKHGITKSEGDGATNKTDVKSKGDKGKLSGERKSVTSKERDGKPSAASSSERGRGEAAKVSKKPEERKEFSDDSSSESEVETQNKKKTNKTFRRREIVSNWEKYELEPGNDDVVTVRGENYDKLLTMAGEAMSHFRFKDELEWDDHSGIDQTDEDDAYSQLLCLNSAQLAQSLSCLPVHQVLGVSQDLFTAEQLKSMAETAKENRSLYNTSTCQQGAEKLIDPTKEKTIETHQDSINHVNIVSPAKNVDKQKKSSSSVSALPNLVKEIDRVSKTENLTSPKRSNSTEDKDNHVKNSIVSGQRLALQDEDLDALLDLDSPAVPKNENIKEISPGTVPSPSSNEAKKGAKESAVLEEWLDSILDD